jgi:hypothetical protein
MSLPIQGPNGKVTQGTANTALVFIQSWDGTLDQATDEQGPFLNDGGATYLSRTSQSLKANMKGIVPSGRDASQTAVVTALTGGTDIQMQLLSTAGYTIACTTMLVESVKLGHDAKGTATFEASVRNNGAFTVS